MQRRRAPLRTVGILLLLVGCSGSDESPTPSVPAPPVTHLPVAKRITSPSELIGGPLSSGRVGDYLLANDRIRVILQDVGRDPIGFVSPYGGNIVDADLVRPTGEPGNDQFMAMSPQINIESTVNVTRIEVVHDGADGQPAVVRTIGVDDGLDYINASQIVKAVPGLPLSVPPWADDVDIPVEIVSEYTLGLGDRHVRIETSIRNVGSEPQGVYVGDYIVNSGGETDLFMPGIGFGQPLARLRVGFLAMRGFGGAAGLTYGYIPRIQDKSTSFTQTGVTATSLGDNIVGVLLLNTRPRVTIPPGEEFSYVRYFVVAEDVAGVNDVRNEVFNLSTGTLRGTVTVDGAPLANATVAVVQTPGSLGADYDVISAFESDAAGAFEGRLPAGRYGVMAAKEGYPYDSGSERPSVTWVNLPAGATEEVDIALPPAGRVRILSMDENDDPLPAKATVVGFDPSPPLPNVQGVLGLLEFSGYVFGDPDGENLFGIARSLFIGPTGDSEEQLLEPGTYQLFVSHGPEYSLHEAPLVVEPRLLTTEEARIARVVDTTGFVSGDFHVHMFHSPDSTVPLENRVTAFLAEGVDYLVASDHEFLTDLWPTIRSLGAERQIFTSTGQEITPQDYGHYHGWPLSRDPSRRNMGALDWGRKAPVGADYRTLGHYCMAPSEIFEAVRSYPGQQVVQINHFNSGGGAGFNILGIDTGAVPPRSTADPAPFRLDPSIDNLFSPNFDALELLIGNDREQVEIFFGENLGDWFNLMNQGLVFTGTSDSDTHRMNAAQAGSFRNFIAASTDNPANLNEAELTRNIREGRIVGGYSPFVRVSLEASSTGGRAGLDLGAPRTVSTTDGRVTLRLEIEAPVWVEFDTVELFVNNEPVPVDDDGDPTTPPQYLAEPDVTLVLGEDFSVDEIVDVPGLPGASHRQADVEHTLEGLDRDTWVVALVRGTDGVSRPLFPVVPNDLSAETNETLEDLLDGNVGEGGMLALAYTNPLFVDTDGNGVFDAQSP